MKQNIGYQIDFVEGKIIVSKKFLKEASDVSTTAYSELVQIRKDYPEFMIAPRQIAKRENKMTYGKLTYNINKEREFTRKGAFYEVSPWALIYDNNTYYLLAFVDDNIRTYRVDRMASVSQGENDRQGKEQFESFDLVSFTKATFGMYSGEEQKVEMVFHNRMIDTVIDKFGKEVFLVPVDDEHFKVTTTISVSPQFFAWIFGLGNYAKIVGPEEVKKQMVEMMTGVLKRYGK